MTRRNYNTPGRRAATAATKTEPGAPRAKKNAPNAGHFRPKAELDDAEPNAVVEPKIVWRDEAVFERDPDFPPSKVKLADHPLNRVALMAQIRDFQAAGFLPVAVSRLVGLRPLDIKRLTSTPNT